MSPRQTLVTVSAILLLTAGLTGCIGSGESADAGPTQDPSAIPDEGFASFEEAMATEGPAFEPSNSTTKTMVKDSVSAEVQGPEYSQSYTFSVDNGSVTRAYVIAEFSPRIPDVEEITVSLTDPDGGQVASARLRATASGSDNLRATLEAPDPASGEWQVTVQGRAAGAAYSLEMKVDSTFVPDYNLKLLEPLAPIPAEMTDFSFLLYRDDETPVENGSVRIRSRMASMGHGTNETEEDPLHDEFGVWRGKIHPSMEGEWIVHVKYKPPGKDPIPFEVPVQVNG